VDLAAWLRELGLERYEQSFRDNQIDARTLPQLTAEDLKELGVNAVGHRRLLLQAIAALSAPHITDDQAVTASAVSSSSKREAERRHLTVLFCDLVGSTELAGQLDPEDMSEIIRAYQNTCAAVVQRWDGHVAKFMGDGVLVYFGYPKAHEDDAERAVRAGLELVEAIARLEPQPDVRLGVRIGVATGRVVVGELVGEGASREESVVGETPNLAARLQALAEPGTVVISQATRRLVGGLFELDDLGPQRLKGFAEPLAVWRVSGESNAEGRFEARHTAGLTPLVGREEEIALLLRRWQQAKESEGQVVLLSGEPGIGKSRLVRELRERLAAEPHIRLLYQCSPHHTTSPLHPVIEQLERAAGFERDDSPENKLDKLEALLARGTNRLDEAVPLIAALIGIPTGDRYALPELTPQRQKQLTLEALADQLEGLSAEQLVLLVYEDAHWIDPTTQELVGLVVERLQRLPVLSIITFRPDFAPTWTGLPQVSALALTRLGRRDGAAMVERVVGAKSLPDEVSAEIVGKTDGVPLFVEELTKTVLESGLLKDAGDRYELSGPLPPLAIPSTLHDSLLARLDRLAPVKEVAQIGAAIGREFSYALLAAVADRPEDQLQAALDQLVSSELVFQRGMPPEATYSFKHALVQDAAYGTLLKPRRQHLHARIAEVLEEQFPEAAEAQPELLAQHCTQAGLVGSAIEYWHKAGQLAIRRSTMAEAVTLLNKGLEALQGLPEGEERDRQELELQVTLGVALLAARGQPAVETGRAYARARDLAQRLGETQALFRALYGLNSHHTSRAEFVAGREVAATLLRRAYDQHDMAAQTLGHRSVGVTAISAGEFAVARTELERVLALYNPVKHRRLAFLYGQDPGPAVPAWLAWPLLAMGYPEQARSQHLEGLARAREMAHPNTLAQTLYCGCVVRQLSRDRLGVVELAEVLVPLATEQGFPYWLAMAIILRGWALSEAGETERGIAQIMRGLTAFRATAAQLWMPYFLGLLAEARGKANEPAEGLRLLAEALDRVERTGERWFEAELHRRRGELLLSLAEGERGEAEPCFHRSIAVGREQNAKLWELRASTSLARLWRDQGRRAEARDLLAPLYGWFTEGFETADLKDAKALLDALA
jgi:predicted ATPase/class 3 adenylate cyclase